MGNQIKPKIQNGVREMLNYHLEPIPIVEFGG
jgi:hypothetical protein